MYQLLFQSAGLYTIVVGQVKHTIMIDPLEGVILVMRDTDKIIELYHPINSGLLTDALCLIITQLSLKAIVIPNDHEGLSESILKNVYRGLGGNTYIQQYYDEDDEVQPGASIFHHACFDNGRFHVLGGQDEFGCNQHFTLSKTLNAKFIKIRIETHTVNWSLVKEEIYCVQANSDRVEFGPLSLENCKELIKHRIDQFSIANLGN